MKNIAFEKWLKKQVDYYSPILGITIDKIDFEFKDEEEYLSIQCTYPYIDPTIYYGKSAIGNWKKGKLKKDRVCHELCHILTDPLYYVALNRYVSKETINNERERLTDIIAAIIRKLDK